MSRTRLAANAGPKKVAKNGHLGTIQKFVGLYLRNYGTYRQSEKNLLSSNTSPTCPHNMVNFGPLAAEILSLVSGNPGNFNGFRVLAALLHGSLIVGVSQTAALNSGCHLYSAGRPSRWALAHISSFICFHHMLVSADSIVCVCVCACELFLIDEIKYVYRKTSNRSRVSSTVQAGFVHGASCMKLHAYRPTLPVSIARYLY